MVVTGCLLFSVGTSSQVRPSLPPGPSELSVVGQEVRSQRVPPETPSRRNPPRYSSVLGYLLTGTVRRSNNRQTPRQEGSDSRNSRHGCRLTRVPERVTTRVALRGSHYLPWDPISSEGNVKDDSGVLARMGRRLTGTASSFGPLLRSSFETPYSSPVDVVSQRYSRVGTQFSELVVGKGSGPRFNSYWIFYYRIYTK